MTPASDLDPATVRRQFARRARHGGYPEFLLREVERRLFEHLDLVRIEPDAVVDVGCGRGPGLLALRQRFPQAKLTGVDLVEGMVRAARDTLAPPRGILARLLRDKSVVAPALVAADMTQLPLAPSSCDLVWSNLALHWCAQPQEAIGQWHQVLRPGGLAMFSAFGVDTLTQLRAAGATLMPFPDLHDLGDAMVHAGFADPVMDMERIDLSYASAAALLDELRALGGNALRTRSRGLCGRSRRRRWEERLAAGAGPNGRVTLSFEIIYGHAWVPATKRRADGAVPITLRRPR